MKTTRIVLVLVGALLVAPGQAAAEDSGYALKFDGVSDFVRLHPTASMLGPAWPTTKTVSLWLNPLGTPSCTGANPASCDAIFGDRPRTWGISRGVLDGQDRIWIWNYDGTMARVGIEYTAGEWIQIALVHGSGMLSAYKNGVWVGGVASGPTVQGSGQVLHVGGIINNASRNWTFEGEIDELQIWNVELSAGEIAQVAGSLLAGTEPGLAAYYQMSDGSGTVLTDDSGNGWTGELIDGGNGVPADGPITWVPSGALGGGTIVINTPPVAYPQDVVTAEDTAVSITLTGFDPDGDPITFHVTTLPAYGLLSGAGASVVYTPVPDFHGADSFSFVVHDGHVYSAPATVSLTVTPVNDPPVANDDVAMTAIETPIAIAVLDNDFDVDGDPLTIVHVGEPAHGIATNEYSYVIYTPEAGFTGTDTFTYTISDGQGAFATATVTVTVTETGVDPGYALRFDGHNDYVTLERTANMMAPTWQTTKTVSLWLKPTGTSYCNAPSPASCDAIFGDRPRWWGISRGVINGQDRIWIWNYDGQIQTIAVPYVVGEWVHIALVHGGGMLSAYRNGVLVGSVASGATQQPSTGALPVLHFGGIINNAVRNWTFEGEIDELQIWNTARTAGQVQQDMVWPLVGPEPDLAAYYRMSDGAGSLLTDDSGQGWTGTLQDGGPGVPADGPILWVPSGAFTPGQ